MLVHVQLTLHKFVFFFTVNGNQVRVVFLALLFCFVKRQQPWRTVELNNK